MQRQPLLLPAGVLGISNPFSGAAQPPPRIQTSREGREGQHVGQVIDLPFRERDDAGQKRRQPDDLPYEASCIGSMTMTWHSTKALMAICIALSGGCGTVATMDEAARPVPFGVYSGVRHDIGAIKHFGHSNPIFSASYYNTMAVIAIFDLPLSFVADTLLLPYTIFQKPARSGQDEVGSRALPLAPKGKRCVAG